MTTDERNVDERLLVESEISRRALGFERQRLRTLAAAVLVPAVGFALLELVDPELVPRVFHGRVTPFHVGVVAVCFATYALGTRAWLTRLAVAQRMPPPWLRYVQAFVETSIPTALMVFLFGVFDPLLALFTPPLLIYGLFIVLSALHLEPGLSVFAGGVAAVEYLVLAAFALSRTHLDLDEPMLFVPIHHVGKAAALLLTGVATGLTAKRIRDGIATSIETLRDRNRVLDVFGKHVSPEVVNKLLAQRTEMVTEERDVCVMFLDIRGFTKFSEAKRPEEVVEYLNRLFDFMIDEIVERGGIINKFLGDGFMAIFGAPLSTGEDCARAVAASLAILSHIEKEVAAGRLPETRVGIALHSGSVITGHVGSHRRREYTVIGDVVNVAARIEAMNKDLGSQFLISDKVLASLSEPPLGIVSLGPIPVRGRGDPIELYRVV